MRAIGAILANGEIRVFRTTPPRRPPPPREGDPFGKVGTSHTSQLQLEKRGNLATWLLIIIQ